MKGKKFLGLLTLSASMLLASCGGGDTPASSTPGSSPEPTPSTSSSVTPTPAETIPALNKTQAEGAVTRDYDERFDKAVEDFSGESISGTTTGTLHSGILREVVDSSLPSFPSTPGAAIFKMASSTFDGDKTLLAQSSVGFKIRVAKGSLSLKDLILGIRPGNDNDANIYPIAMHEAVNADGEANPEVLTNEFQDITVDVGASIGDENAVFPGTELKVFSNSLGFHLYAKEGADIHAIVEIEEVYYYSGTNKIVIDEFARDAIGGNSATGRVYWGPTDMADAVLVRKGLTLAKGQSYKTADLSEEQASKTHVVLTALGDLSGAKMKVTYAGGETKELPFASWKANDAAVVNAVDGAYSNLAIDLAAFGGTGAVKNIELLNEGEKEVEIASVFMTSFELPELDKKYPAINTKNAVTFYNFNRNFASLNDNWVVSAQDERNIADGVNGMVAYGDASGISISDGSMKIAARETDANVVIGTKHVLDGADYLVFSMKGEEGADLNNFRFNVSNQGAISFANALAMEGVKTYADPTYTSPYVTSEGFTWYVIDLAANKIHAGDLINIFYSGEKGIEIDSIFYATGLSLIPTREGWGSNVEVDLSGAYQYGGNSGPVAAGGQYLGFTVVGDGELATLESFRFEYNGKTLYPSKGECEILDEFGRVVDPTTKIPAEGATYYVKLKGSQFGDGPDGWANVHYSGEAGCQGTAKVTRVFRADEGCGVSVMEEHTVEVPVGYAYSGGWTATCHIDRLYLHLKGNEKGNLSDFRIEAGAGQFFYAKDHAGMIQDLDGNPIDLSTKIGDYVDEKTNKSMDIVIDLAAAGIDLKKGDAFHFHNTYTEEGTSITFGAALGVANDVPAEIALAEYVQDWAK